MIGAVCLSLVCSGSLDETFFVFQAMVFSIEHLAASFLGMLIVGVVLLPWILRKKKNTPTEGIHRSTGHPHTEQLLLHHDTGNHQNGAQADPSELHYPQQLLTKKELSFLEFLYLNSSNGKLTSIAAINQFLGVENRTMDIQKRMRSDLISSINHKISVSAGLSQPVIDKKRSAFDKRSFDYFILDNHFDLVRSLVFAR